MKGSPMHRNFGIGSPAKNRITDLTGMDKEQIKAASDHNNAHASGKSPHKNRITDLTGMDEKQKQAASAHNNAHASGKSPHKQKLEEGSASSATVGDKEYPNIRYLTDAQTKSLNLPGSVFKGGKNTGDADDVIANAYDNYLGSLTKSPEKGTTTTVENPGAREKGPEVTTTKVVK